LAMLAAIRCASSLAMRFAAAWAKRALP
jgi:hypothetical protein